MLTTLLENKYVADFADIYNLSFLHLLNLENFKDKKAPGWILVFPPLTKRIPRSSISDGKKPYMRGSDGLCT